MIPRRIFSLLSFIFFLFFVSFNAFSEVSFRTSSDKLDSRIFVSIDFKLSSGEHITSPTGKGKSISPNVSWKNAEVVNVHWPKSGKLSNSDGSESGYFGYDKNFSVIYELIIKDKNKSVTYDLFYVTCGNACIPTQKIDTLKPNGLLSQSEISNAFELPKNSENGILMMLLFGFLGGLILNFMPCVFPIISMKIFSIVKSMEHSKGTVRRQAFAFSSGILTTFIILCLILNILRSSAPNIGWGFYMQEPAFVFAILLMFLICAIHFFGIFTFQFPGIKRFKLPVKNIYISAYFSGIFSGVASSSCVGPFAGVALAGALLYGNLFQSFLIFLSLGFGLSLPFLLISLFPGVINKFPKPGKWLDIFKEFMGFAMLFSCIWPFSILMDQISSSKITVILIVVIAFVALFWILNNLRDFKLFKLISIAGILGTAFLGFNTIFSKDLNEDSINWKEYSEKFFDDSKTKNVPIFLNFTASWCMNCQFNQGLFSDPEVVSAFRKNGILAIKCDWTKRNDSITKLMAKYGAIAVPLYVYYPGDGANFEVLPTILTKQNLLNFIEGNRNAK